MYSFFMSGKAWDTATEYEGSPDEAWLLDDDELDEDAESTASDEGDEFDLEGDDELEDEMPPNAEQLQQFHAMIKTMSSEEQAEFVALFQQETGLPAMFTEMLISVMRSIDNPELLAALFDLNPDLGLPEAGVAADTTLDSLGLHKGQKFLYLFDYGDEWRFNVKVHAFNPSAPEDLDYPVLVEAVGDSPPQYPDWDEEDEAWDAEQE